MDIPSVDLKGGKDHQGRGYDALKLLLTDLYFSYILIHRIMVHCGV